MATLLLSNTLCRNGLYKNVRLFCRLYNVVMFIIYDNKNRPMIVATATPDNFLLLLFRTRDIVLVVVVYTSLSSKQEYTVKHDFYKKPSTTYFEKFL